MNFNVHSALFFGQFSKGGDVHVQKFRPEQPTNPFIRTIITRAA